MNTIQKSCPPAPQKGTYCTYNTSIGRWEVRPNLGDTSIHNQKHPMTPPPAPKKGYTVCYMDGEWVFVPNVPVQNRANF